MIRKQMIPFIAILCIGGMLLAACAAGSAPAEPVDASASVSEPAPELEPESAVEPEPEQEPKPESEFHCDFDAAVEAFFSDTQDNADINPEEDPVPLYEYLFSEEITSAYVKGQECAHPYSEGYLYWCQTGRVYDPENAAEEENAHGRPYEERRRDYGEQVREAEERRRQMEEEAAREEAEIIEELEGLDYDHSLTFDF